MSEDITVSEDGERITVEVAIEGATITFLGSEEGPFRYEGEGEPPEEAVAKLRDAGHLFEEISASASDPDTDRDGPEGADDNDVRDAIEELEDSS